MHPYDIAMLVILAAAMIFGAIKGFAWQVASLASIVVSFFVASYFRHDVAKVINAQPPWNMFLAMLLLYFGSSLAIWMVFRLISSSIDKIRLKEFDRQLGAAFGLIKGACLCCVLTMFAMTLLGPNQKTAIARSRSGYYIAQAIAQAGAIMPSEVKEVIGPYLANVERDLEQGRTAEGLPVPVDVQGTGGLGGNGNSLGSDLMRGIEGQGGAGGSSAGGILERFLGNNTRPTGGVPNGQLGPNGAPGFGSGNEILPPGVGTNRQQSSTGGGVGVPSAPPVLPQLPF